MKSAFDKARVEFWSNCEYTGFMPRIVELLREDGWDCSHRYLIPYQSYRGAQGTLGRLWLRFKMYALYPLYLSARVFFNRSEAILVVTTNTFYAPAVALLLRSRKQRVIHLVYDLFPESLIHAGMLKEQSPGARLLNRLQAWVLRKADLNILLGENLKAYLENKHSQVANSVVIAVGANEVPFPPRKPAEPGQPFRILYCGNMGYMHDPASIGKLIQEPGETIAERCRLSFHSNGKGYARLMEMLGDAVPGWVSLNGFLDDAQWVDKMRQSDIALIIMGEGAENILMPSKAYSALVAGQALLAIAPEHSDLAEIIRLEKCGWLVAPGDV
ncbi:MAG: hypothetical protein ACQKBW_02785, partial [Puniceicoccales bacterium]